MGPLNSSTSANGTSRKWRYVQLPAAKSSKSDIGETLLAGLDLSSAEAASFENRARNSSKEVLS